MASQQTADKQKRLKTKEGHPQRWWILAVLCLSLVLVVAANSGVNVALPTLARELGASQTELQWIVDAYSVIFAGLLLPAGALGDRFGRKRALQGGLLLFGAASIWASFASVAGDVIAARLAMGLAAAFIMPATLSILTVVFPPSQRGRAISIWAGFAGAGGAIGPVMSGFLLENFSWSAVFLINVPIVLLALATGLWLIPQSSDPHQRPLDPVGSIFSVIGLASLLFSIIEAPNYGLSDPLILGSFAVGIVSLLAFSQWEQRIEEPMVDLSWFRIRSFATGTAALALAFFAFLGVIFLITQYFQFVLGYSPLRAGLSQLPLPIMVLFVSPQSASLVDRFNPRQVVAGGLFILAAGLFYLALVVTLQTPYLVVVPALVLVGSGIALSTAPSTTLILTSLPPGKAGVGSAMNDVMRQLGAAIGVAVLGAVLTAFYRGGINTLDLADDIRLQAQESIGAALQLAQDTDAGTMLADVARQSFTDGFRAALIGGGLVAIIAAAAVFQLGPAKTPQEQESDD